MAGEISCSKCGSTQLTTKDKGFSLGNAALGTIIAGPLGGFVGGMVGSKKTKVVCLKCGYEWEVGKK